MPLNVRRKAKKTLKKPSTARLRGAASERETSVGSVVSAVLERGRAVRLGYANRRARRPVNGDGARSHRSRHARRRRRSRRRAAALRAAEEMDTASQSRGRFPQKPAAGVFNTNRSPNTLAAEHPPVGFGTVLWFGALVRSGGNRWECAKSALSCRCPGVALAEHNAGRWHLRRLRVRNRTPGWLR